MEQTPETNANLLPPTPAKPAPGKWIFLVAIIIGFAVAAITVIAFLVVWNKKTPDYTKQLSAISDNLSKSVAQSEKTNEKTAEPKLGDSLQGYQAVFLTNGQVYFGKYTIFNSDYALLTDIYYLRTGNALQNSGPANDLAIPQISLVRLGNELHGPQDAMYILKSSVLFVENLKNDGQVAKAINAYKSSGR